MLGEAIESIIKLLVDKLAKARFLLQMYECRYVRDVVKKDYSALEFDLQKK